MLCLSLLPHQAVLLVNADETWTKFEALTIAIQLHVVLSFFLFLAPRPPDNQQRIVGLVYEEKYLLLSLVDLH